MKIGRRIYYDIDNGNVLVDTGERQGSVKTTTVERDIETYKELSDRNQETFDVIELEYGQYNQDFRESSGYRVNIDTKELEFSYPDPEDSNENTVYQKPLTDQVEGLKGQVFDLDTRLMNVEMGGM